VITYLLLGLAVILLDVLIFYRSTGEWFTIGKYPTPMIVTVLAIGYLVWPVVLAFNIFEAYKDNTNG